jgi:hypothetical protein
MSEQLRIRGDIAGNVAAYTGPSRETVVDTTNNRLVVQDGVTPGGWPAAKLAEINRVARTAIFASYSALASDRLIAVAAIVSPIYVTLPPAASFQAGARLLVIDESGAASFSTTITIVPAGTDGIAGAFSNAIGAAYGFVELESNGIGQWTISNAVAAGAATINASSAIANIAPAATRISGQAVIGVSQPVFSLVISEPRLKAGMRPVVAVVNPFGASSGTMAIVNISAYAPGEISVFGVLLTLDGKTAPSQKARMIVTFNYLGA